MSEFPHCKQPCVECPWRVDVPVGHFPPKRYVALANTAYNLSAHIFACHKTSDEKVMACAGFLCHGADHNMSVRMAYIQGRLTRDFTNGGYELFEDYREMAIANGVDEDNPALRGCR